MTALGHPVVYGVLLILAAGGIAFVLTWALRYYALSKGILDRPNHRSSHTIATPRGGGIAIVLAYLLALFSNYIVDSTTTAFLFACTVGGGLVAVMGFLDDHGHIPARWRLLGHFSAAGWILFLLGGLPPLKVFGSIWDLGWTGYVIGSLFLVWLLNLYNFMDGIDGIASVEAISVCTASALLAFVSFGIWSPVSFLPLILAAAVAGFLVWNFPPAKIFMGDAGSGFLGLMLGALTVYSAFADPQLFWSWLILLGVFVVDSTFTLLRRVLNGEKVYEAHRNHAYQHATRLYGSHLPVTLAVLAINVGWLTPWAFAAGLGLVDGVLGCFLSYLPLLYLAIRYKAGGQDSTA